MGFVGGGGSGRDRESRSIANAMNLSPAEETVSSFHSERYECLRRTKEVGSQ